MSMKIETQTEKELITHAVLSFIHTRATKPFKSPSAVSQQVNLQSNMAGVRYPEQNVHMTTCTECYCQYQQTGSVTHELDGSQD